MDLAEQDTVECHIGGRCQDVAFVGAFEAMLCYLLTWIYVEACGGCGEEQAKVMRTSPTWIHPE
jgi:hypothetical protein